MGASGNKKSVALTDPLLVFVGGYLGTISRYLVQKSTDSYDGTWPIVTFVINIAGSFALGLLIGSKPSSRIRLLLGTGFCGAFTTYGTFAVEVQSHLRQSQSLVAFSYVALSILLGLVTFAIGAKALRPRDLPSDPDIENVA